MIAMDRASETVSTWAYVQAWAGFLLGGVAAAVSMQMNIAALTGDCGYRGLTPPMSAALLLLPLLGGLVSYRIARTADERSWLYVISRIAADFCIFIIALIVMHMVFITFFWVCNA
jgi:hypothetical protein